MKFYDKQFAKIGYGMEVFNGLRFSTNMAYENRKVLFNTTDHTIRPKMAYSYTSNNPLRPK